MSGSTPRAVTRRLAERLARRVVLKRRLPEVFGGRPLFVSPDASLRFWKLGLAHADVFLLGMVEECVVQGQAVWDIGANVGLFALAAAHRAGPQGHVLAVEPDAWTAGLIRRSLGLVQNRDLRLDVLTAAVADRCGAEQLAVAARGRAANHLARVPGSTQSGGTRERQWVPALSLDSLLDAFPRPAVVKIDVEEAESLVLEGAGRLLRDVRPLLICEVCAESSERVSAMLAAAGYRLFDAGRPPAQRLPMARAAWNTLAVPDAG